MVGFDGPWGWVPSFRSAMQHSQTDFVFVDTITDADIVYQADTSHWRLTAKYLQARQKLICNVLDFAHWKHDDGRFDPEIVEYVEKLVSKADKVGCISHDGIRKLKDNFNIDADIFYYPSQFYTTDYAPGVKKNPVIIKTARLGDPGKRVDFLLNAWEESNIAAQGWRFILVGPERPPVARLPKNVMYAGYLDVQSLKLNIRHAAYLIMGRKACGLGLPAVEAALLGTQSIMKFAEPMNEMWYEKHQLFFDKDEQLPSVLSEAANTFFFDPAILEYNATVAARPWARDVAFQAQREMLANA